MPRAACSSRSTSLLVSPPRVATPARPLGALPWIVRTHCTWMCRCREARGCARAANANHRHLIVDNQSSPPAPGHGEQASESLPTALMTWMQRATPACSRPT